MVLTTPLINDIPLKILHITMAKELKTWNQKGPSISSPTVRHSLRSAVLRTEAGSTTGSFISEGRKLNWCHCIRSSSVDFERESLFLTSTFWFLWWKIFHLVFYFLLLQHSKTRFTLKSPISRYPNLVCEEYPFLTGLPPLRMASHRHHRLSHSDNPKRFKCSSRRVLSEIRGEYLKGHFSSCHLIRQ